MNFRKLFAVMATAITVASFTACSKSGEKAGSVAEGGAAEHDHEGFWCDEHGVPHDVCARCDTNLVAGFKEKGDWCEKHNRPDSQCFVCHPEKEAEFAALFEAKYGKKPPKPEPEGSEEHEEHGKS